MHRHRWLALALRTAHLLRHPPQPTAALVQRSYDRVAPAYDDAWTHHMRRYSLVMLDRLQPAPGGCALDLACGTGYLTAELARRTGGHVTGVDAAHEMLTVARSRGAPGCEFIHADILAYLRHCPRRQFDTVTCGWALGYSRPWPVVGQIARVLRPGGRVGIIDNTLFSLAGVLWTSVLAFAERPAALAHAMQVRFLPGSWALAALLRAAGLAVESAWDGAHTYYVPDGRAAIARLTATGAAAGFEFAAAEPDRDIVFDRFAALLDQRYGTPAGIPITHRFLAALGHKP